MDSRPSPSDVPVLHRALRPLAAAGQRPLRRVGTVLRSTLSFGRGLGTGIVRREGASSPAGLSQVRVPDGAWHLPQVKAPTATGPIDTDMAALAASMRRHRVERPVEPVQRGVPIVSRRMGRTDAAGGVGPSGLSRRLRPAESAIPRNDSHGADRVANPRDDDPPGGVRRPAPSRPPTGPSPAARRSASSASPGPAPSPRAQQSRTQPSRSQPARLQPSRGAAPHAVTTASSMPVQPPGPSRGSAPQHRVQRSANYPGAPASLNPLLPAQKRPSSSESPSPTTTPITNGSPQGNVSALSSGDARTVSPRAKTLPVSSPGQPGPARNTPANVPPVQPPPRSPAHRIGELALRQRSRPLSHIPAAVSQASSDLSSPPWTTTPGQRLTRRLSTGLPTPARLQRDDASLGSGGQTLRRQPQSSRTPMTASPDRDAVIADRSLPLHERVAALAATGPTGRSAPSSSWVGDDRPMAPPMAAPRMVVQRRAASAAADRLTGSSPTAQRRSAQPSRSRALAAITPTTQRSSTQPVSRRAESSLPRDRVSTPPARVPTAVAGRDVERALFSATQTDTSPRVAQHSSSNPSAPITPPSSRTPPSAALPETAIVTPTVNRSPADVEQPTTPGVDTDQRHHPRSDAGVGRVSSLAHTVAARRQHTPSHPSSVVASATVGRSVTRSLSDLSASASTVAGGASVRRAVNASVTSTAANRRLAASVVASAAEARPVLTDVASSPRIVDDRARRPDAVPTSEVSPASHRNVHAGGTSTPARASADSARRWGVVSVAAQPTAGAVQRRVRRAAARTDAVTASSSVPPTAPTTGASKSVPDVVSDRSLPLHERVAALAAAAPASSNRPMVSAPAETYTDPIRRRRATGLATGMVRSGLRLSPPMELVGAADSPMTISSTVSSARLADGDARGNTATASDPVSSPAMSLPVASRPVISRRIAALTQPIGGTFSLDFSSADQIDTRLTTAPQSVETMVNRSAVTGQPAVSRSESAPVSRGSAPMTSTISVPSSVGSTAPSASSWVIADLPVRRRVDIAARTHEQRARHPGATPASTAQAARRSASPSQLAEPRAAHPGLLTAHRNAPSPATPVGSVSTEVAHGQIADASLPVDPPSSPEGAPPPTRAPLGVAPVARRSIEMGSAIVRRARRGVMTSADARQVTTTHEGGLDGIGESRSTTADRGANRDAANGGVIQRSPAPGLASGVASTSGFVSTPTGEMVAAEVVDRNLPLAQRVAALNRRPTETTTARPVSAATPDGLTNRTGDVVPSAVPPTHAASTLVTAPHSPVRRSPTSGRAPRLTASRSPQVIQPQPVPSPRAAVVMKATASGDDGRVASASPGRRDVGSRPSARLPAPTSTLPSRGLVYRSSDSSDSRPSAVPVAAPTDSDTTPMIRRSPSRGRVVRSRSSISRRTVPATTTAAPIQRCATTDSAEPNGAPAMTEHLDSVDELMEALEDRIMRALERRGGIQRGWF